MEGETKTEDLLPLQNAAEAVLREALGSDQPIRLEARDTLRERGRNRVVRYAIVEGPAGAPETVIAKMAYGEGEDAYDPEKDMQGGTTWRFLNEWAGNAFLQSLNLQPPLSAHIYGSSRDTGVIVLEDLGAPSSLADRMQAEDKPALESALHNYAMSMGRLHAGTAGRAEEMAALRRQIGGTDESQKQEGTEWLKENVAPFEKLCADLGVAIPSGYSEEIEKVRVVMDDPGPFLAFTPGDTCPDNHRIMDDGSLRFFDFEFAGFSHALLGASYLHLPFPTCWCVNRLPTDVALQLEAVYRTELIRGCPEAADDSRFAREMALAFAFWLIATLSWGFEGALKEDSKWGISTIRQRHLLRLENFRPIAERGGELPALITLTQDLLARLRERWLGELEEEMPLYPSFRMVR